MQSSTSPNRATKGSVGIENFQGRLRLRLPRELYEGKQKYLTLGLDDTPDNRRLAEAKKQLMESDIRYERFDLTLNKYRAGQTRLVEATAIPKQAVDIGQLWKKYATAKKPSCSPGTWKNGYLVMGKHIDTCPHKNIDESQAIVNWAIANLTPDTARRLLMQINACCKWALKSKLISHNPFDGMVQEIKVKKASTENDDIEPFTAEERDTIIQAFSTSRYYSYYTAFVRFLFFTGCRPSEAIALQWKHITDRAIHFEQAVVSGEKGLTLKRGLKTQEKRNFPINGQLRDVLTSIKPEYANADDIVFPGPKGGWIDIHNFRNRAWKSVLDGLNIKYRKPYQARHTFVTLCLDSGTDAKDVARWVGNSPGVIYKHYAGNRRDLQVPEI
jgi:integrase